MKLKYRASLCNYAASVISNSRENNKTMFITLYDHDKISGNDAYCLRTRKSLLEDTILTVVPSTSYE